MVSRVLLAMTLLISMWAVASCNGNDDDDTSTGDTDSDTDSDSDDVQGVCGMRGEATVFTDSYSGTEEYFLTADEGYGEDVCIVRYDVNYVGEAPDAEDCFLGKWAHTLEFSNPVTVADEGGVCESSDLALDAATIAALDGMQVHYCHGRDMSDHANVLYSYDEDQGAWMGIATSGWDEDTGAFHYTISLGWCEY